MYNGTIEQWFSAYANDVYSFLVYFTGSRDVEDLVQETFTKALTSMQRYQAKSHPKAWLISIARNAAVDALRREKLRRSLSDEALEHIVMPGDSVEDIVAGRVTRERLTNVIAGLRPNHRAVFIVRGIQGFSVEESANILGWSTAKVRTTFHRAMKEAKQKFLEIPTGGMTNEIAE